MAAAIRVDFRTGQFRIKHSGKHPIKQEIVVFVCFYYYFFFFSFFFLGGVFLWFRSITCCTEFVRENGLSPTFSGLWMGTRFEFHTVLEVFCQQVLLLPTQEIISVNGRSSICLCMCLLPFGSHSQGHCWSSFYTLPFQNYSNPHCHWYEDVHFCSVFLSVL